MQVQLQGSSGGSVADGENVLFDTPLNLDSVDITYNAATGVFTFSEPANYFVSWWVNADGAEEEVNVEFTIETSGGAAISAASPQPMATIQLQGQALLTIGSVPTTMSLVNNSGVSVNLGISPVQADIVILQVTQ